MRRNLPYDTMHTRMIAETVRELVAKGFRVEADHLHDFNQPNAIHWRGARTGHIPDVMATNGSRKLIAEVETPDSINDQHTYDQLKLFSAFAQLNGYEFILVIPPDIRPEADRIVRSLGITASIRTM